MIDEAFVEENRCFLGAGGYRRIGLLSVEQTVLKTVSSCL